MPDSSLERIEVGGAEKEDNTYLVLSANLRCLPPQTLKAFSPKKMTKNSQCRKDLVRITGEISIWIIN